MLRREKYHQCIRFSFQPLAYDHAHKPRGIQKYANYGLICHKTPKTALHRSQFKRIRLLPRAGFLLKAVCQLRMYLRMLYWAVGDQVL